ncbi:hypothetical protein QTP88_023313 [Uroleucon formosanum]
MGGRRAGSKGNRTPPAVTNVKKVRSGCISPQPLLEVVTLQQRVDLPSPEPDTESLSGKSYILTTDLGSQSASEASVADPSPTTSSVSPTSKSGMSTINDNSPDPKTPITSLLPPIIIAATLWRQAAAQSSKQLNPKNPSKTDYAPLSTKPLVSSPTRTPNTQHLNYANATKNKQAINTATMINLLSELLSSISLAEDPKEVISKATAVRGMLYPALNRSSPIPTTTKINLLQLYVKPILSYADPAWGPLLSEANWRKLEAVQNIGLRTIITSPWFVLNRTIHFSARSSTIKQSVIINSKKFFYRNSESTFSHIRKLGLQSTVTDTTVKYLKTSLYLWANPNN